MPLNRGTLALVLAACMWGCGSCHHEKAARGGWPLYDQSPSFPARMGPAGSFRVPPGLPSLAHAPTCLCTLWRHRRHLVLRAVECRTPLHRSRECGTASSGHPCHHHPAVSALPQRAGLALATPWHQSLSSGSAPRDGKQRGERRLISVAGKSSDRWQCARLGYLHRARQAPEQCFSLAGCHNGQHWCRGDLLIALCSR
jgi:hypothetical protein